MRRFSCYAWIGIAAVVATALGGAAGVARGTMVRAAVLRSGGTLFPSSMIWNELSYNWSSYGTVPVLIDTVSLAGDITSENLRKASPDVVIISSAGFLDYSDVEVQAVVDWVQDGHDIIITYNSFRDNKSAFGPLVGLGSDVQVSTGTAINPIRFDILNPAHPLFRNVSSNYVTGVPYVSYAPADKPWPVVDGVVLANKYAGFLGNEMGILSKETAQYRGLYFSYYIENKSAGANAQDAQLFYNGLVWAAGIPEPGTWLSMVVVAGGFSGCRRPRLGA